MEGGTGRDVLDPQSGGAGTSVFSLEGVAGTSSAPTTSLVAGVTLAQLQDPDQLKAMGLCDTLIILGDSSIGSQPVSVVSASQLCTLFRSVFVTFAPVGGTPATTEVTLQSAPHPTPPISAVVTGTLACSCSDISLDSFHHCMVWFLTS